MSPLGVDTDQLGTLAPGPNGSSAHDAWTAAMPLGVP